MRHRKTQALSAQNIKDRLKFCIVTLKRIRAARYRIRISQKLSPLAIDQISFSDEKYFKCQDPANVGKNHPVRLPIKLTKKAAITSSPKVVRNGVFTKEAADRHHGGQHVGLQVWHFTSIRNACWSQN